MGTWNIKINGNDTFLDVYQSYFSLYNEGQDPVAVSKTIKSDYAEMFNDYDDKNNCLFALALAQWETKTLEAEIYNQVKNIIQSGDDLEKWKELGAVDKMIEKRKDILYKFLTQISTEREKPKRRQRTKFEFVQIPIVDITAPDNKKFFMSNENYVNGVYEQTSSMMTWKPGVDKDLINGGGTSVFYFVGQGKKISAKWIDNQTLQVTHDRDIEFTQKNLRAYFCGDDVKVIYQEK